ncbi:hypothetical protein Tco_0756513 [Tanacetum coccineum]
MLKEMCCAIEIVLIAYTFSLCFFDAAIHEIAMWLWENYLKLWAVVVEWKKEERKVTRTLAGQHHERGVCSHGRFLALIACWITTGENDPYLGKATTRVVFVAMAGRMSFSPVSPPLQRNLGAKALMLPIKPMANPLHKVRPWMEEVQLGTSSRIMSYIIGLEPQGYQP